MTPTIIVRLAEKRNTGPNTIALVRACGGRRARRDGNIPAAIAVSRWKTAEDEEHEGILLRGDGLFGPAHVPRHLTDTSGLQ